MPVPWTETVGWAASRKQQKHDALDLGQLNLELLEAVVET